MSLEAIAALLGHRSLDMTLRYAKIANRTVADEYFAVTEKVDALYGQTRPAARRRHRTRRWPGCAASTTACSATATAPDPPSWTAPSSPSARPARFFQTSIEFRPTLQAQHDDAAAHGQTRRQELFARLIHQTDDGQHHDHLTPITRIMPNSGYFAERILMRRSVGTSPAAATIGEPASSFICKGADG